MHYADYVYIYIYICDMFMYIIYIIVIIHTCMYAHIHRNVRIHRWIQCYIRMFTYTHLCIYDICLHIYMYIYMSCSPRSPKKKNRRHLSILGAGGNAEKSDPRPWAFLRQYLTLGEIHRCPMGKRLFMACTIDTGILLI